jgi:hypothetical protein
MAGTPIVFTRHPTGWNFASATGGIVNTTTAVTLKAAPADNTTRNYITDLQVQSATLGGATELAIRALAHPASDYGAAAGGLQLPVSSPRQPRQPAGSRDALGRHRRRMGQRPGLYGSLAMDPALNAIIAPWAQLGIVGSIVLALGVTVYLQWRHIVELYAAHLADVKACAASNADLLLKKTESDNALANALERVSDRIKP